VIVPLGKETTSDVLKGDENVGSNKATSESGISGIQESRSIARNPIIHDSGNDATL
jgi:hypothetical protein